MSDTQGLIVAIERDLMVTGEITHSKSGSADVDLLRGEVAKLLSLVVDPKPELDMWWICVAGRWRQIKLLLDKLAAESNR